MCSNFEPIKKENNQWVNSHFDCDLPDSPWPAEVYPTYPAPFIYLDNGKPRCELAQFGLVPQWLKTRKSMGYALTMLVAKLFMKSQVTVKRGVKGTLAWLLWRAFTNQVGRLAKLFDGESKELTLNQ